MSVRSILFNALYPIIRVVGDVRVTPRQRKIKFIIAWAAEKLVQEGDVICTRAEGELTNKFITGDFKHCGIYLGGSVVESTRDGVHYTNWFDFLMTKDVFAVVRPKFYINLDHMKESLLKYLGLPYDYWFTPGLSAFTCAELVGQLLADGAGEAIPFTKRTILGVPTIHPSDFVDAIEKFERIV